MPEEASDNPKQSSNESADSVEQSTTDEPSLGKVVTDFVTQVDSLADTLPLTMVAMNLAKGLAGAQLAKLKKDVSSLDIVDHLTATQRLKRFQKASHAGTLVSRTFLVSIVSQYDAFLGAVIRALLVLRPQLLNISERQITYAELLEFGSIGSACDHIIEKEAESVLRKSHSEQFDWLETKFSIPLRKGLEIWPRFIELTERRNLFVHASGVVSQQYLAICSKHNVVHDQMIERGQELQVTQAYFQEAYDCIIEIGVKIVHTLWRKVLPSDRENADINLNRVCYDLLAENRFMLARKLLDFAVEQKKHSSEQHRRIFVINRAQAYKWSGDDLACRRIVGAEDWTASSDSFRLAAKVLLDEYEDAAAIMRKVGPNGEPKRNEYRDWPLFSAFRKSQAFLSAFAEVYGQPFCETPRQNSEHDHLDKLDTWLAELAKDWSRITVPEFMLTDGTAAENVEDVPTLS
jgi:hypothetical protein